jgi:hypothetical protein
LLLLLVATSNSFAAEFTPPPLPSVTAVHLGFGEKYKLGCWTPLVVNLRGATVAVRGTISVTVPDGDGVGVRFRSEPVDVPIGLDAQAAFYVNIGRHIDQLQVDFEHDRILSGEPRALSSVPIADPLELGTKLFVNVGPLVASAEALATRGAVLVGVERLDQLPDRWIGYEGVDGLIVTATGAELLGRLANDTGHFLAIEDWIAAGGMLAFVGGPGVPNLLAEHSALGQLIPGTVSKTVVLSRGDALEAYSGSSQRLALPATRSNDSRQSIPRLVDVHGVVEATEGNVPLVVRAPRGLGQLVFVAVPLDAAPWADWAGRDALVARVLSIADLGSAATPEPNARAALYGVSDLAGQLYAALDQFRGVRVVSFWIVTGLAMVYLALIGPVDFLFAQRVLRRLEATWITLPALVAATVVAVGVLGIAEKGIGDRINQLDLIDIDTENGTLRGTSWLSLFSTRAQRLDVGIQRDRGETTDEASDQSIISFTPPGNGWGGMHSAAVEPQGFEEPYAVSMLLDRLRAVPIEPWSTKSFCARWTAHVGETVEAELHAAVEDSVRGRITNRLKVPLKDCLLLAGRYGYMLGDLPTGAQTEIATERRRDLEVVLKQFAVVKSEKNNSYLQAPIPYDPANLDVPTILRTMMFYQALGGHNYAQVADAQQSFVDLSALLSLGRAVLLAEVEPASGLAVEWQDQSRPLSNGDGRRWQFCRIVFEVK